MAKVSELVFRVRADTKGVKQGMDPAIKSLTQADKAAQHLDSTLDKLEHDKVKIGVQDEAIRAAQKRIDALKADIIKRTSMGLDTKVARRELRELEATVKQIRGKTVHTRVKVDGVGKATAEVAELKAELLGLVGLGGGLGKFVPILAAIGAAAVALDFGRDNEKLAASFDLVTKSAEKTKLVMDAIDEIGTTRPIDMGDLEDAGLMLARFRIEAAAIPGLLSDLSDTALGTGKSVTDLATAVGQLTVVGEAQAKQLKTLERTGVPVYEALAVATGKTVDEVKSLAKQGRFTQENIRGMVRVLGEMNKEASSRATETLDGQLVILKNRFGEVAESIGMELLPAAKGVGNAFAGIALVLEKLPAPLVAAVIQFGLLAGAGKILGAVMPGATRGVKGLLSAVGGASGGAGKFKAGLGGVVGALGGPWTLALVGAVSLLGLYASEQADAAEATKQFQEALDFSTGAMTENNRKVVANRLGTKGMIDQAKKLGISTLDLTQAILGEGSARARVQAQIEKYVHAAEDGTAATESNREVAASLGVAMDEASDEVATAKTNFSEMASAAGLSAEALAENASAAERLGSKLQLTGDGYKLVISAAKGSSEAADDVADAYEAQHDAIEGVVTSIGKLLSNMDILKQRSIAQKQSAREQAAADRAAKTAMLDRKDAQKDAADAVKKFGASSTEAKRATFELADANDDVAASLEAQAQANVAAYGANLQAGKGQQYANEQYAKGHTALLKNIEASGIANGHAKDYAQTLEDTPETVATKYTQSGLDEIVALLRIIAKPIMVKIQADLTASFWNAKQQLDNMGRTVTQRSNQGVPNTPSGQSSGSAPRESGGMSTQNSNGPTQLGTSAGSAPSGSAFSGGGGSTTNLNHAALVGGTGTTVNVFVQDRKLVNLVDVTVSTQVQAAVLTVTRKRVITV